ncbi:type ISP restriction/modification enzyme (plasmid) [Thiothrix lacustris]|uniref:Type ISP restriction/modification enzyme n=1 Tax=Thiothrix lacustris TaxID=525917 RepID=A0ABY9MVE1_9GAMM|nr:type ISP restriction/modification enzyme [Thiothrix lacustris]WML92518.1 type ISP restriction/modification enzyme [Thiothrix lacustris]
MTPLQTLLTTYRDASQTHREKGTYFEDLICTYLRNEASYRDLYSKVWTYADWAREQGLDARDTGIDLVAQTHGTNEFHAIQCKFYAPDYRIQKRDIDSFFTASGKKPFTHRLIITTTNHWSEHADDALRDQQPPVSKIDLNDLENSQIDWSRYQPNQPAVFKAKKTLRDHQKKALAKVQQGLQTADRGKLIMACGTGKTFTSLKIAESLAGSGKRVLFLVPSLSLLSQTLTEWTQESATPLHSFAVCSDSDVGNKRKKDDDIVQTFAHELRYPATTKPDRLAQELGKRHDSHHMSVVFSTYHSIDVISKAQQAHGLAAFDLIICDEAHRTTGATFDDEDESSFVKVHDAAFIQASKRLYMTATPRIYADSTKVTAERDNVALCSMDNAALYGQDLYVISFSEAVKQGLLVDYKVLVLSIDEAHISRSLQNLLKDDDNQLKVDDAAKIVGCWKALSKQGTTQDLVDDQAFMRRAVAFCQVIEPAKNPKYHKVSSKNIAAMFQEVVEAYQEHEREQQTEFETPPALTLDCEAAHVDGGMNASQKEEKLNWLKAETPDNTCRILSNVRCLSEGVDVPALDAVLFLTPRNSQVDVVQSVGRVMRLAPGKKRGYIILPVVIPAGVEPHKALEDNKTYKVVWQVLQALRSHDDRFDAMVNKLDLNGPDTSKMEVIAITDKIAKKANKPTKKDTGKGEFGIGKKPPKRGKGGKGDGTGSEQMDLTLEVDEIQRAIYAKIVKKVGNRGHWEDWANDIAKIARTHITRIQAILDTPSNSAEIAAFQAFAEELRDDLNNAITDAEIVEMLAQHLITKPVFEALFKDYSFAEHNPMSKAMQDVLEKLEAHRLDKEADTLQAFYDSVKMRAEGIDNAAGKQKIVVELYDKFFRNAFPRMTERLGIVYTPVEVVDFIIHSVNDVLQSEFGQTLGDENVHIIDPFTGTGTFITRLLQSGLITPEQLPYKYQHEIHANEIVLLAYYIAAINIEAVYHDLVGGEYQPFNGICLTDTFQLHEKPDLVDRILVDNSARRVKQKALDIRVIIGNPPYSAGQKNANDNNANIDYPVLDERIRSTYATHSIATNKNSLYNSYIRAIRWASDRIEDSGVIGFVTDASFVDGLSMDGLRKCLVEEFSNIYIFHLRGLRGQRTAGERAKQEGGQIFGQGSGAAIAITLFVKNPAASEHGRIYLHDIGDYLTQAEKLKKISAFGSINGIAAAQGWQSIMPDAHNDWVGQRDDGFSEFISLGDKKDKNSVAIFENYSRGIATSRDAWCYNFSKKTVATNIRNMISFYNSEVRRYKTACDEGKIPAIDSFINSDSTKISWNRSLKNDLEKLKKHTYDETSLVIGIYRPFTKSPVYFSKYMNDMVYQMPRIFPDSLVENRVIMIKQRCPKNSQIALMLNCIPELQTDGGSQCFPLKLYEPSTDAESSAPQPDLFTPAPITAPTTATPRHTSRDGITDAGLAHFQAAYPGETISKEDLFYYIYGLLHSEDYKAKYADNLTKELPRIPAVKQAADFWHFSTAGRELAELHVNYETQTPYPVTLDCGSRKLAELQDKDFYVTKMKFASKGDKSTVVYNHAITIKGIPLAAYDYVVNGKPALEWVMERQGVSTHKDSGIVNDANDWAIETMKNARYPLELFQRVVTVSLRTMEIVRGLPVLKV